MSMNPCDVGPDVRRRWWPHATKSRNSTSQGSQFHLQWLVEMSLVTLRRDLVLLGTLKAIMVEGVAGCYWAAVWTRSRRGAGFDVVGLWEVIFRWVCGKWFCLFGAGLLNYEWLLLEMLMGCQVDPMGALRYEGEFGLYDILMTGYFESCNIRCRVGWLRFWLSRWVAE